MHDVHRKERETSSYVVNNETIDKVISFFHLTAAGPDSHKCFIRELRNAGYDMRDEEDQKKLAKHMFMMNIRAVEERYGPGEAEDFRDLDYEYQFTISTNAINAFKSLECLLYQCAEGIVPQLDLYKLLREVTHLMAVDIVTNSKAYDATGWG